MDTPEFLIWAIEHTCPIRGQQNGSDPERTERQLRAARAVSDAHREGRVFEGLCIDPPLGFRIDDALAVYGGLAAVEEACRDCPANALAEKYTFERLTAGWITLAGCYGLVPLPADPRPLHAAIDRGWEIEAPDVELPTRPRWYGLWLHSPLEADCLFQTWRILNAAPLEGQPCRAVIDELKLGLNAAYNAGARLHVSLFPRGRVEERTWRLAAHCQRCKAEWRSARSRQCAVCGYVGGPAAEQKRKARGERPYFPLERLLGETHAAEFLVRYAAFRERQASPDRAQNRPPRGPPDSPPAD